MLRHLVAPVAQTVLTPLFVPAGVTLHLQRAALRAHPSLSGTKIDVKPIYERVQQDA